MRRVGAPRTWRVGDTVDGRYEVAQVHGQGAMGLVHRVRHLGWGTDLAVKSPRPEMFTDASGRARFIAEAEAWVGLGLHPNVCACHYVRVLDGIPRVFAEYVRGGSLRDRIDDGRLYAGDPPGVLARVLDLAIQAARGLDHAHSRGLVHQDVKPANILVDEDGTAKITDFGLARARTAPPASGPGPAPAAPQASAVAPNGGLTPAYASPEQAEGRPLGRSSDVYSLAVSVLEMFTGGITWMSGSVAGAALEAVREEGGSDALAVDLPERTAALLQRCLRTDPAQRPGSMAEVAEGLAESYRDALGHGHPRPVPVAADLRADELNNRALSLLDLGRTADADAAFEEAQAADPRHAPSAYNRGLLRWRRAEETDEGLLSRVEALRDGDGEPGRVRHLLAQVHLERGDRRSARALLEENERERPGAAEDAPLWAALRSRTAPDSQAEGTFEVPWHSAFDSTRMRPLDPPARLTPDGGLALTGGNDGGVRLWDLVGGRCLRTLEGRGLGVGSCDVSADGRYAVSAYSGVGIRFWDLEEGVRLHDFTDPGKGHLADTGDARIDALGRIAVAVVEESRGVWKLWVWDFRRGRAERRIDLGRADGAGYGVTLSGDGRRALVTSWGTAPSWICHLADGGLHRLQSRSDNVTAAWMSHDGRSAATASRGDAIRVWDTASGRCTTEIPSRVGEIGSLSLNDHANRAITGGHDGKVRFWDLAGGRCLRTFDGHGATVVAVQTVADGWAGVSLGADNTMRRWKLGPPGAQVATTYLVRPSPQTELNRRRAEAEGLVARAERAIAEHRPLDAVPLLAKARTVPGHERAPRAMAAWRALGTSVSRTGLRSASPLRTLSGPTRTGDAVAISADGRIGMSRGGNTAHLWDLSQGTLLRGVSKERLGSIGLRSDGRRAMTVSLFTIEIQETGPDARVVASLDTGSVSGASRGGGLLGPGATQVRLSGDGTRALGACHDNTLRMWDVEAGTCLWAREGPGKKVGSFWLTPDGQRAAAFGDDGEVVVWDGDGTEQARFRHGDGMLRMDKVCLSNDGRRALTVSFSAGPDPELRLWDASTGEHLSTFSHGPTMVSALHITSDGRFAVTGSLDGGIHVWDADAGELLRVLEGHTAIVGSLALSSDDAFLLSGSGDGTARLWELDWELS